jgi:hypothetical protein
MSVSRPLDTSPEAQAVQDAIYRALGPYRRVETAFRLTASARALAAAGVRHRHPHYSDEQVDAAVARLVLGDDLVREVWPNRDMVEP